MTESKKKSSAVLVGSKLIPPKVPKRKKYTLKVVLLLRKCKSNIKKWWHTYRLQTLSFYRDYLEVPKKGKIILKWLIDVIITGLIISYCLNNRNFLSYGLISALAVYYIRWLVYTIKKPPSQDDEEMTLWS